MITLDIATTRAEYLMGEIAHEMGIAGPEMLKNEGRLLMLECIRKTWPQRKEEGEAAISNDLSRLFTSVDTGFLDRVGSEFGTRNIGHWITFSGNKKVFLNWEILDPMGSGMSKWHQMKRNSKGRIPKGFRTGWREEGRWDAKYVVTKDDLTAYTKTVMNRVGFMKSGWLAGLIECSDGSTKGVGQFVVRHMGRYGSASSFVSSPERSSISMRNNAPGIGSTEKIVQAAMFTREISLERRMKRVLAGIKDSIAAGSSFGGRFSRQQIVNEGTVFS